MKPRRPQTSINSRLSPQRYLSSRLSTVAIEANCSQARPTPNRYSQTKQTVPRVGLRASRNYSSLHNSPLKLTCTIQSSLSVNPLQICKEIKNILKAYSSVANKPTKKEKKCMQLAQIRLQRQSIAIKGRLRGQPAHCTGYNEFKSTKTSIRKNSLCNLPERSLRETVAEVRTQFFQNSQQITFQHMLITQVCIEKSRHGHQVYPINLNQLELSTGHNLLSKLHDVEQGGKKIKKATSRLSLSRPNSGTSLTRNNPTVKCTPTDMIVSGAARPLLIGTQVKGIELRK